jgi:hypothetical protein
MAYLDRPRILPSGKLETPSETKRRVEKRQKGRSDALSQYLANRQYRQPKFRISRSRGTQEKMLKLREKANKLRSLAKHIISQLKSGELNFSKFIKSDDAYKLRKFRASTFLKPAFGRKEAKNILKNAKMVGYRIPVRHRGSKKRYRHGRLGRLIIQAASSYITLFPEQHKKKGVKRVAKRILKRVAKRSAKRGAKRSAKRVAKKHKTSRRRKM